MFLIDRWTRDFGGDEVKGISLAIKNCPTGRRRQIDDSARGLVQSSYL